MSDNELILINARWVAICNILDGNEPPDFMLVFPEIKQVLALFKASQQDDSADLKQLKKDSKLPDDMINYNYKEII